MVRARHSPSRVELLLLPDDLLFRIFLCFLPCLIDIIHVGRCNKKLATNLCSEIGRIRERPKDAADAMGVSYLKESVHVRGYYRNHLWKYVRFNRVLKHLDLCKVVVGYEGAEALALAIAHSVSLMSVNLSSNNLTGENYIEASEVEGDSFEVGDKVIYWGREMLVSKGKDLGGGIKMRPLDWRSGIKALADALRVSASLTEVNLGTNSLCDEGTEFIATALKESSTSKLQKLEMSSNDIGPKGAAALMAYAAVSASLTSLSLEKNSIGGYYDEDNYEIVFTPEGPRAIADALRVDLRGNEFGEVGWCTIFDTLRDNPQNKISKWNLFDERISPPLPPRRPHLVVKSLVGYAAVSASLTSLILSGNNIQGSGEALGEALKSNKSLKELTMSNCSLNAEDGKGLAGGLAVHASLTAANVLKNDFDADAVSTLLKVKQEHPKLTTLCGFKGDETSIDFRYRGLGPVDAMLIAPEVSVMASLTSANFSRNNLGAEVSAKALAPGIAGSASLTSLTLNHNNLRGSGYALGDALKANKSLKELNMTHCSLAKDGKGLAGGLAANASLTSADFSWSALGAEGAKALAPGIASSASLTECSLSGNLLGDEGTEYIATALLESATSKLQKLMMSRNNIGPKGGAALAGYIAISASLTKLNICFNALGGNVDIQRAVRGKEGFDLLC